MSSRPKVQFYIHVLWCCCCLCASILDVSISEQLVSSRAWVHREYTCHLGEYTCQGNWPGIGLITGCVCWLTGQKTDSRDYSVLPVLYMDGRIIWKTLLRPDFPVREITSDTFESFWTGSGRWRGMFVTAAVYTTSCWGSPCDRRIQVQLEYDRILPWHRCKLNMESPFLTFCVIVQEKVLRQRWPRWDSRETVWFTYVVQRDCDIRYACIAPMICTCTESDQWKCNVTFPWCCCNHDMTLLGYLRMLHACISKLCYDPLVTPVILAESLFCRCTHMCINWCRRYTSGGNLYAGMGTCAAKIDILSSFV